MKTFSIGNQDRLKADEGGRAESRHHRPSRAHHTEAAMTRLDAQYRDYKNGMIDYDHYRRRAATLRREPRSVLIKPAWERVAAYFKFPQKRWMRRQASSKSSVLVA
jgi:hypothetical protein